METRVLRLNPGDDLREALERWTRGSGAQAAFVAAAVGSLARARLRFAGREFASLIEQPLELTSLSGTLSPDGVHLHAAVAGPDGQVLGGHVLSGCIVRTTAEIVIGLVSGVRFGREHDPATGYRELVVRPPGSG